MKSFSFMVFLSILIWSCNSKPNFSGHWTCKTNKEKTLDIKEIAKNTYEILIDKAYTITGEVNTNDVLTSNSMGHNSLWILQNNELHWSDGDCREFIKQPY
ncbi:MAG: hypothetical protein R2783_01700 [Gelidibacter sp.]